jgi:hypothetical protein
MLKMRGVGNVLNAKNAQEAQIVEEAGKPVWLPLQLIWRVVEQILS